MKKMRNFFILMILLISSQTSAVAQKSDSAYVQTIKNRAWKIVENLNIADQQRAFSIRDVIANQYMNLNDIYNNADYTWNDADLASNDYTQIASSIYNWDNLWSRDVYEIEWIMVGDGTPCKFKEMRMGELNGDGWQVEYEAILNETGLSGLNDNTKVLFSLKRNMFSMEGASPVFVFKMKKKSSV